LPERIRQGKFREDLYYRLNVVPLEMPSLDKRRGDIPLLVGHFVEKICRLESIGVKRVTPEALDHLRTCPWPGNIRQLENAVEKALAMSDDRETLFASDFSASYPIHRQVIHPALPAGGESGEPVDFATAVREFEYSILQRALSKTSGNRTAAAELLGMKRTTLIMKLRNFRNCAVLQPG
jgi:DNA-binding NtrC family response regulator